jgi:DNA-binding phage protein
MTTQSIKKRVVLSPYDVADHLRTTEEINAFLEACTLEADGDTALLNHALAAVARAKVKHQLV